MNVEDELALRNLMSRYIDAVARRDGDAWAATWCEDATWSFPGSEVSGRASILALWRQMMEGFDFALMMPSSCLFEIDGDTASGHWYIQEHTRDREGNCAMLLSRYRDRYRTPGVQIVGGVDVDDRPVPAAHDRLVRHGALRARRPATG